jgi:BioD-like phosphotransacetylase family protein
MRRVWRFLVDLADGVVAALLYGGQGGLTYTTSELERENQEKIRGWAARGKEPIQAAEETTANFAERVRRYRDRVTEPDRPS